MYIEPLFLLLIRTQWFALCLWTIKRFHCWGTKSCWDIFQSIKTKKNIKNIIFSPDIFFPKKKNHVIEVETYKFGHARKEVQKTWTVGWKYNKLSYAIDLDTKRWIANAKSGNNKNMYRIKRVTTKKSTSIGDFKKMRASANEKKVKKKSK